MSQYIGLHVILTTVHLSGTGSSDPYVKISHGKYKARSTVVNRNLNPVWNETFVFQAKDLTQPISLRVYDHDIVSSDDFMGRGLINLTQCKQNK